MSILKYVIYAIRYKIVEILITLSEWDDESSESNHSNANSSHDSNPDN
jgi:hypothetical protein